MKVITSNLTNQQLQQLAHQVLNQFDQTVIDNWMQRMANPTCAPNYFRQDIINHIYTRAGREPDEIVKVCRNVQRSLCRKHRRSRRMPTPTTR